MSVKPDATPEEVSAVAEGGGQQIFAQAVGKSYLHDLIYLIDKTLQLTSSPRYAESRNAYREVQERQEDLKKMEQTLVELTELFIDVRERQILQSEYAPDELWRWEL